MENKKIYILVAEDDPVLREVYVKKFELSGFEIKTTENGEETLQALEVREPHLLLLDLNMPVVDGFAVLKRYPKGKRTFPIVILTNFGDDLNRKKGIELGADDFFVKSEMTIRSLLEKVEALLAAKKA